MSAIVKYLRESSLGRLHQHATDLSYPIAIMTAFRDKDASGRKYTHAENVKRNQELAAEIRRAGYGYVTVEGSYIENVGTPNEVKVKEESFFIIGKKGEDGQLKGLVKQWRAKWDQDSVLYRPKGTKEAIYIHKNGTEGSIGEFHPNRMSSYMTALTGSKGTFVFEGLVIEHLPNIIERMVQCKAEGKKSDAFFSIK